MHILTPTPLTVHDDDRTDVSEIEEALSRSPDAAWLLSDDKGLAYRVPPVVRDGLIALTRGLNQEPAVAVLSVAARLSEDEAAHILGVSRRTLAELLDRGDLEALPSDNETGGCRWLSLAEVLRHRREAAAGGGAPPLRELVRLSEQMELYGGRGIGMPITVTLATDVMMASRQRDRLLACADAGLLRCRWSEDSHEHLARWLAARGGSFAASAVLTQLERGWPEAVVPQSAYAPLLARLPLPLPLRHQFAAAIVSRSAYLVSGSAGALQNELDAEPPVSIITPEHLLSVVRQQDCAEFARAERNLQACSSSGSC